MSKENEEREVTKGPVKGEFISPPELSGEEEITDALPPQEDFWKPPVRFGSVPVEKEPHGLDRSDNVQSRIK